jgi:hypothetical protein
MLGPSFTGEKVEVRRITGDLLDLSFTIVAFTHERQKVNASLAETRGFQRARAPVSRTDQSGALPFGDITRTNVGDLDEPFNRSVHVKVCARFSYVHRRP